jgi:ribosomal protein S18 acetylase RimI-like enzyme
MHDWAGPRHHFSQWPAATGSPSSERLVMGVDEMGDHPLVIRYAEAADHGRVIAVVDSWWGGRPMAAMLPRLFFIHFRDTSFVADEGGDLAGFLCGFRSQTYDDEAYVHFVGVDPGRRGSGLGRQLYERFFEAVAPRTIIRAVTSPLNTQSVAFHRALGFEVEKIDDAYDGRGEPRVLLMKRLTGSAS